MIIIEYMIGIAGCFLLWTFCIYWLHRLSHIHHKRNPLWKIHQAHHRIKYFQLRPYEPPSLGSYFFWLGDFKTSFDVFLVMTVPLLIISYFFPQYGIGLLIFHYFYEVFGSEAVLDHNPRIEGKITHYFAWGSYHLYHHVDLKKNYGLMTTFWDHVFGTAVHPEAGFLASKLQKN